MKNTVKYILQRLLGFQRYLYVFSKFKIATLKSDKKEGDFFTFMSLLKSGEGDILDIGANIGIMSVHLAKAFPNETIHAFEPMPDNLSVLKKIISHYQLSNVKVYPIAIGSEKGTMEMVMPRNGKTRMQGLSHIKHDSITEWNEGDEFEVEVELLDNLFDQQKIQGIKIDIENFEYFAFLGGQKLIKKNHPIIYAELWSNENRENCFKLLKALDYEIFVVENKVLKAYDPSSCVAQNFIFKPTNPNILR